MTTTLGRAVALAVVAATLLLHSCTSASPDEPPAGPAAASPVNATSAPLLPPAVDQLPTFDFTQFEDLGRQLLGTPVIVNFWSSWCGPCRSEAPHLVAAAHRYGRRVQFLGIDILDNRDAAASFIRQYRLNYPSLFDPSGDIRDNLGFIGQPETVFYDRDGTVDSTWIGPLPSDELRSRIAALLR